MEERIRKIVSEALGADIAFAVERPADLAHGDYAVNAAMVAARELGKSPRELADSLAETLKTALGEDASRVEVAGPGFINITLSKSVVVGIMENATHEEWGRGMLNAGKRVMVEYGNPNPFKEMHVGHLVGSIVGEALSRLVENEGAAVARDTFGGDVGPNVAKALWALRKKNILDPSPKDIGDAYAHGARAYEESEEAKKEIDELNKIIYADADEGVMDLWRRGREVSMEEFRRIWKILGTHFDYEFFDSDTGESGMRIVRDGLAKGIFKESDGAIIYDGEKKGVHTMVFITSHHTPTYEAKDIGLAFLKEERWPADEIVIVTGNEQTGRFKTVLAALSEIAPQVAAKMRHVATGFLRLASGKMSSREGNVITAAAFLEDVMRRAAAKNADPIIAEQVAVGAVKYMILRQAPGADIIFDPEKSLSLLGDSGPYLQYALVRGAKILSYESEQAGGSEEPEAPYAIERIILHFPQVVARAAREYAPQLLAQYLTELAGAWNAFYAKEQVLGSAAEAYKLRTTRAFAHTMNKGLTLLGIPTPEKM